MYNFRGMDSSCASDFNTLVVFKDKSTLIYAAHCTRIEFTGNLARYFALLSKIHL